MSDGVEETSVHSSRPGGSTAGYRPFRRHSSPSFSSRPVGAAGHGVGGGGGAGRIAGGGGAAGHGVGGGGAAGRRVSGGGASGRGDRPPYGYNSSPYPLVGGLEPCPHCFCSPCVVNNPPTFLVGSCPADIRNASKRYLLYRKFWRLLKDIGLWRHEPYLTQKAMRTSRADAREIIPTCVTKVNASCMCNIIRSN